MIRQRFFVSILFVLALAISVCIGSISLYAMEARDSQQYKGIDVSEWQGKIDFAKVKADGIDYVYIRSSKGTDYVDRYFNNNYSDAKKNGLNIGFYHYVTSKTLSEAKKEAEYFASVVKDKEYKCKLAMDFESFGSLKKEEINQIALEFITTLEKVTGKEAIVYSNSYTANWIFDSRLSSYDLWIAEYGVKTPADSKVWKTWAGFQYSDKGRVNGINGNVDLDYFTKDMLLNINDSEDKEGSGNTSNTEKGNLGNTSNTENENSGNTDKGEINEGSNNNIITIVVKKGDTLYKLASKYNTTVNSIISLNQIKNPSQINIGQKLKVNSVKSKTKYYTILKGDTLSKIGKKFNLTVNELIKLNNINNPNKIYVGEKLRVG